jgi:hypothetical protein
MPKEDNAGWLVLVAKLADLSLVGGDTFAQSLNFVLSRSGSLLYIWPHWLLCPAWYF